MALPKEAHAAFDLTLTPTNAAQTYALTWSAAVDPATPTAKITYFIYDAVGRITPNVATSTQIATVFDATALVISTSAGTNCYRLQAWNVVSGVFDQSDTECHNFLHHPNATNSGIARVDGNGGQLGFNQQWFFTYFLDSDALVTMRVFPPTAQFGVDSLGFTFVASPSTPTKIIAENTPRSGEMIDGGTSNTEFWDSRNSSGATVANGLYFAEILVENPLLTPRTRFRGVVSIPVDIIRFTNFTTSGISDTQALANINYTVTGDASVRIVIAKPGRQFTLDSSGNVQPLDENGNIDTSSHSVVQVITFNRKAGTYSETWNGTDTNGLAVSSGIYSVGLSAQDGFGNRALDLSGNDGPVSGTLTVDRQGSQTASDTTAPTVAGITVGFSTISLTGITQLSAGFSKITVNLNETAGTGGNESTISLTDPSGASVAGTLATSGSSVTFTPGAAQTSTGTYTLIVTARDAVGNGSAATNFQFALDATAPSINAITIVGRQIDFNGGTELSVSFSSVVVLLNEAGGTGAKISTITLTNPSGANVSSAPLTVSGSSLVFTASSAQSSTGTYTLSVTAVDGLGNVTGPNIYTFTLDPTPPAVGSIRVAGSSISLSGSSSLQIFFSSIVVQLNEDSGTGEFVSTVTLTNPLGGAVTGQSEISGDQVIFNSQFLQTSGGNYTITVLSRDILGNGAPAAAYSFFNDPVGPSISAITVAGSTASLIGGSKFAIAFSSIVVRLDESAGTGSKESTITMTDPKGNAVAGVISTFGSSVTFTAFTLQTASGSYTLTVTARDAIGNTAPTVSVSFSIDASGPTVQSIAVGGSGIDLGGGTTITGSFTSLIVLLDEASGTGATISTVTLTDPNSTAVAGALSISGSSLTFTPTASQSTAGSYTLTVSARDSLGNATTPTGYSFLLSAGSTSGTTQTQEAFEASVIPYPNPVRTAPLQVEFEMGAAGTVDFEIFTILGERLFHQNQAYPAGTQTFNWALLNDAARTIGNGVYLFRITATMGSQTRKVTKKVMVVQ